MTLRENEKGKDKGIECLHVVGMCWESGSHLLQDLIDLARIDLLPNEVKPPYRD